MPTGYGSRVPVPARGGGGANPGEPNSLPDRHSGLGAVGLGFLSGDVDDDEDDDQYNAQPQNHPPSSSDSATGWQQPVSRPPQAATFIPTPHVLQTRREPPIYNDPRTNVRVVIPNTAQPTPRPPRPAFIPVPQPAPPRQGSILSPVPLDAPSIPITPAFARPSVANQQREIKFSAESILRGNSEETLLSRSTPKGAEFWRRFSVIVKEEQFGSRAPGKRSSWLSKNRARSSRMSFCVWAIAISLLLAIGGLVVLVWFLTHNSPSSVPRALGGSANQTANTSTTTTTSSSSTSTSSPLRTVTGDLPPSVTSSIPLPSSAPTAR